jgi:ectoine hydroxylase-related dioxygenase (phytanoyl-CoA dioxygenase family)
VGTARAKPEGRAIEGIARDYERFGYAVVASPFDADEIAAWRRECDRLWSLPHVADGSEFRVDPRATVDGHSVPERLDPVIDASPLFAALSRDDRVLRIARALLRDEPLLFKDKLIAKLPRTTGYRTHQDFAYIAFLGFPASHQLAIAIAVDAADADNGAIEVFPGRHDRLLPAAADDPHLSDESALDPTSPARLDLEPGDMLVMHSLCPHRSAPNRTQSARRLLFFTYNAAASGDHYETYYRLGKP